MAKKKRTKKNRGFRKTLSMIVLIIIAAASAAHFYQPSSSELGSIDKLVEEFHQAGSEGNLKQYFPDARLIRSEQRNRSSFRYYYAADENRTIIFKYYYLEGENKTVVACDRNVTIAICPGKTSSLTAEDVERCMVTDSTAFSLTGNTTSP